VFPKGVRVQDTMALEECRLKPCLICGAKADAHHIRSKKAGGHDLEHNLCPLCRTHHVEIHKLGIFTFANKYEVFKEFLLKHNWELTPQNKWLHAEG
jgi:predicted restriction endonuclease